MAVVIPALHCQSTLTDTGLLNEDDNGRTDLGTLEKRLAEKEKESSSRRASAVPGSNATSPSQGTLATPTQDGNGSSPRSALTSPEPASEKEADKRNGNGEKTAEEVEALSDMM